MQGQEKGAAGQKSRSEEIDELMQFLKPGRELGLTVRKHLDELPQKYVVLLVTGHKKYGLLGEQLIKYFLGKGEEGILVTTNKPAANLIEELGKGKVDAGKLFFIDAVSRKSNEDEVDGERVVYVDSPEDLTELDSAISDCAEKLQGKGKFLVVDSLSTLLVYNNEKTLEKFVHSLSGRMRAKGFKVVLTLVSRRQETLSVLGQFCDKVIEL